MTKLYKIYNKTLGVYPGNPNRNNKWYIALHHAERGLRQYQWKRPGDDFEIHEFDIVYKGVVSNET